MRRAWRRLRDTQQGHASARIVSYNILGDGARLALSPKHAYCPIELREWPGRCLRLAREAAEYEADIICLQECSLRAFAQLQDEINSAAGGVGPRYQGVHSTQCIHEPGTNGEKKRLAASWTASETGLAIYVRVDSGWDPVASRSVRLGSLIDSRHSGELRKKLKSQSEGALMQVLRHRGTGASLLVATTHIFWDPAYPHVKACQAELACLAVRRLLSEQQHPTAVVLGGDWNSVPHLQPEFLPVMPTGALERLPPAWRRSAVYELLAAGRLVSDHPEHPDAFRNGARVSVAAASGGHAAVAYRAEALDEGSLGGAANGASSAAPAVSVPAAPLPVAPCASPSVDPSPAGSNGEPPRTRPVPAGGRFASRLGPLTAHGLNLKDAYDGALCEGPLPLTTHAGQFKGALDYIWVSRGELDPAAGVRGSGTVGSCAEGIAGVGHLTFGSRAARVGTIAPATVVEVLNMPFDLVEPVAGWESFGPIPDRTWPSDHLAIGATVAVPGMGE